jgi:hopanoid biosynthesis associated protein HpnK
MAPLDRARRLIVNADDFGKSRSINQAVVLAHRNGILTSASLIVNGAAAEEAVELARKNPQLGVGLHLVLVAGNSRLPPAKSPGLVDREGRFSDHPVSSGLRFFFQRRLRQPIEREIADQFARFRATGLVLDHVNGHLHLHLHPTVLRIVLAQAGQWGVRAMRLTRDPLLLNLRLRRGRYLRRLVEGAVFTVLARWAKIQLRQSGIVHTGQVFGLLQNRHVDALFIETLMARLPPGDSELYSHPSLDEFRNEFEALVAPRARLAALENGVRLVRYQDL